MRVFLKSIFLQVFIHAYVFWRGWQLLPKKRWIRIPFATLFGLEFVIFLTGFFANESMPLGMRHWVAWMGTTWMVVLIYSGILLLGYDLIRFLNKRFKLIPRINLDSIRLRRVYYTVTMIFVAVIMLLGNYNFKHPSVTEKTLIVKKEAPGIDSIRIVMVSDIHAGALIRKDIVSMYVDRIMEQKPDMVVMVGDIIDYDLESLVDQQMEEELQRLKAPYGVYASTGNHEYIPWKDEPLDQGVKWLNDVAQLKMLRDTAIMIDSAFYLTGREDDKWPGRKPLKEIMKDVDKNYPIIVLNHEPKNLAEEVENGADIALYGHTHNGQLFPYNFVIGWVYEVGYGYKNKEGMHVYVSSGLGLAGPQYRIGTKSEIVVLNVIFEK